MGQKRTVKRYTDEFRYEVVSYHYTHGEQEPETQESLQKKIEALERALEYERLRCRGYEKLIEIAEREEGISILKKDGARQ